jgi:hypothetical protein
MQLLHNGAPIVKKGDLMTTRINAAEAEELAVQAIIVDEAGNADTGATVEDYDEGNEADIAVEDEALEHMAQQVAEIVADDPITLNTKWAAVAVYGGHLVDKRTLQAMYHCLTVPALFNEQDHGVRSIIIRGDGMPKKANGDSIAALAACDAKAMVINLEYLAEHALEFVSSCPGFSIIAKWQWEMLMTVLHEAFHLCLHAAGVEDHSETECETWAEESAYELLKLVDVEPGNISEMTYLQEFIADCGAEYLGEKAWAELLRKLDKRIMLETVGTAETVTHHTLKAAMRAGDKDPDDTIWDADTIKALAETPDLDAAMLQMVNPAMLGDVGAAMGEEVVEEAPAPIVEPAPAAPVTPTPEPAPAMQEVAPAPAYQPTQPGPISEANAALGAQNLRQLPDNGLDMASCNKLLGQVVNKVLHYLFDRTIRVGVYAGHDHGFVWWNERPKVIAADGSHVDNPDFAQLMTYDELLASVIPLTAEEQQVVIGFQHKRAEGGQGWQDYNLDNGGVRIIPTKDRVPMVRLILNMAGSKKYRCILPQNPSKKKADGTTPTYPAGMAQQGHKIAWITEGDLEVERDLKAVGCGTFYVKMVNGTPEFLTTKDTPEQAAARAAVNARYYGA